MVYIYECHLSGSLYKEFEELNYNELYCETCGDFDREVGVFETGKEADEFIENYYMMLHCQHHKTQHRKKINE